ncbi:MAG: CPBP family intramembrane metalloprotease [Xenococcaceae cyanobacterium MO_188.B19]|nr:CPBP family intramembrane metalloprotease [Xenococcaceae cyanobacterium MO_188.B19]
MSGQYLSLGKKGKNSWWRYFISFLVILFFYQIIGVIPFSVLSIMLTLDNDPATNLNPETLQLEGVAPLISYLVINFILISLLIGLYIAVRFLHQRHIITLITPNKQIRWKRIFQGFGLYFFLVSVTSGVAMLLSSSNYELTFKLNSFLVFLPVALVLTPIQASAEELFFRGYLMQTLALKTNNSLIPIFGSSVLFMLLHLFNPEAQSNFFLMATFYFLFGIFFAFITIKDNSLELAIGTHTANNLFVVLILNHSRSVLPSPSIFTGFNFDPLSSLTAFIFTAVSFCFIIFKK